MRAVLPSWLLLSLVACGGGGGGGGNAPPPSQSPPPPPPVNLAPEVALPNDDTHVVQFHTLNYDASQGGKTFRDAEGDAMTYEVIVGRSPGPNFMDPPPGVTVTGSRVTGAPQTLETIWVTIKATDARGAGPQIDWFGIMVDPNGAPVAANAAAPVLVQAGQAVSIDATQGGARFSDPDGDPITYRVSQRGLPGVSINGTQISGSLNAIGAVEITVTATDPYGASTDDAFLIAAPGPAPGAPVLPLTPYDYKDESLPLPFVFKISSEGQIPLWDTQFDHRTTDAGAALGRVLFHDKRLSITNTVACASCHQRSHGFASPERFNTGVLGIPLKRNAMALANARYNIHAAWFSDMRAGRISEVARQALTTADEMGAHLPALESKLRDASFYPPLFEAAFGTSEINSERVLLALEQYVQALISYRSKYDRACSNMENEPSDCGAVLSAEEMRGAGIFEGQATISCRMCHGLSVVAMDWQANNGLDEVPTDPGIQAPGLNRDGYPGKFRAASLRNIALTAPYMHDGRFSTLREVIDHYDHGIKDVQAVDPLLRNGGVVSRMNLSEEDKQALEAFLRSLTDDAMIADPKFSDPFQ